MFVCTKKFNEPPPTTSKFLCFRFRVKERKVDNEEHFRRPVRIRVTVVMPRVEAA